jgi:DNA recombination protein RmuC
VIWIAAALFAVVVAAALFAVMLNLRKFMRDQNERFESRLRDEFSGIETRFHQKSEQFIQSANERFLHEQTRSKAVFDQSKQSVENHVDNLVRELSKITQMVGELEKDRIHKFVALEEKLAQTATATQSLSQAASRLSSVIGNNQLRGQWGQKMAEDILKAAGLEEGIHYHKEKSQETVQTRPDYTFVLPDSHKVYMDVKFPLSNYLQLTSSEVKAEQERYAADFFRDVKLRIRELKKREYINPGEQTLDYIILFIPNEQIFGFIHREAPEVMEEALAQKILLTSPYSLYGVLSIIRQAYDNFYFKKSTHDILKLLSAFLDDYENFKKRFSDLGEAIDRSKEKYLEVSDKSFKRLDQKLRKIDDFRRGQDKIASPDEKTSDFLLP